MIPTRPGEVSLVFSRHEFAYRYASQFVAGKDVLDLGCGTGYGTRMMSESARSVLGIDHDASAVNYCRTHFSAPNVTFEQADATNLQIRNEFDVAVSFQVIEHVRDTDAFVRLLKRAVRPGGPILITTPNVRTPQAESGNPFHFSEMSHDEFSSLLSRHFKDFRIVGIGYGSRNLLRSLIQRLPSYRRIGLWLKRDSRLKGAAARAAGATQYALLEKDVSARAIDLLSICVNDTATD